ncbi:MAG: hypothetical protein KKC20_16810, partial [Proteobacteria bacterium]|nr:hypothetical protein [Pseudomonadota bacterium]
TALMGFFVWFSNRDKARSKDIKDVKETTSKDIKAVETRVTKLETSAITHKDLGEVYERVNDLSTTLAEVKGTVGGIKGAVDMIQEYLLNNGGKQ